jgi:ABC-type polysaccharide/polyol phosphate export permease
VYQRFAHSHLLGISVFNLYLANPVACIVMGFQRALYGVVTPKGASGPVLLPVSVPWLAMLLAFVGLGSLVLLFLAWRTFFNLSGDFAEEL